MHSKTETGKMVIVLEKEFAETLCRIHRGNWTEPSADCLNAKSVRSTRCYKN